MEWQITPIITMGEGGVLSNRWLLFRTGNIAQPVAVIDDYEMKQIIEQYEKHTARKRKTE